MVDFVDKVTVHLKAGNGGDGCSSIRREKFKPLAGPNGGNGGNGGSIIFKASDQSTSLLDYHFSKKHVAQNGSLGLGGDKDGIKGENLILPVPLGTVIKYYNENTCKTEIVHDFEKIDDEFEVCKGGIGGLGNARLANSQRKAPGFALLGTKGEEAKLILELKLLADVALVGFPSSGKSSIIAAISAARPKIADYPFTTLTPNLGVVSVRGHTFTVADVPGLIPGAALGKGLGLEFLRHIERTKVIVHVIDMNTYEPGRDPVSDFDAIMHELSEYDKSFGESSNLITDRKQLILLNKVDDKSARDLAELTREHFLGNGFTSEDVMLVSAATHEGLDIFKNRLSDVLNDITNSKSNSKFKTQIEVDNPRSDMSDLFADQFTHLPDCDLADSHNISDSLQNSQNTSERKVINLTPLKARNRSNGKHGHRNEFSITQKGGSQPYFEIVSEKLRNWVLQTDFTNDEAVGYLADRLTKIGVEDELAKMGAKEHASVRIITKNTRAPYIISQQEFYEFEYEPGLYAGAEMLYSNVRGEDTRLDMHERSQRPTRKEKRDAFHERQDARAQMREQFEQEKHDGFWTD